MLAPLLLLCEWRVFVAFPPPFSRLACYLGTLCLSRFRFLSRFPSRSTFVYLRTYPQQRVCVFFLARFVFLTSFLPCRPLFPADYVSYKYFSLWNSWKTRTASRCNAGCRTCAWRTASSTRP